MKKFAAVLLGSTVLASIASTTLAPPTIGVSWNNFQEGAGAVDERRSAVVEANGILYFGGRAVVGQQLTDVNLISQGADAPIILAQDQEAIPPAVGRPAEGIAVVAMDNCSSRRTAFYLRQRKSAVCRPRICRQPAPRLHQKQQCRPERRLLLGLMEVLKDAIDKGDIKNVGEAYTDNWDRRWRRRRQP